MALPPPSRPAELPDPATCGAVIVGMSGGVDSAVSAWLLHRWGYAVQGLFMSNWEDDEDAYCTTAHDFQDARRVCEAIGLPLHRVSFAAEYRESVFAHFLKEYAAGRTPNPDVLCNREIKFGVCMDYMRRLGGSWIATGHYARVVHGPQASRLMKATDATKDQSYFLHGISAAALSRCLFPIGAMLKADVRRLAHGAGLPVFDKPDSTGICFIGERPFADFLARYLRQARGPIETDTGAIIGEHRGLPFYTLGQRSGLKVGGRAGAAQAPWYVADKDRARNALIVVQDQDHPRLLSQEFQVAELNWLGTVPRNGTPCQVKTRYRQRDLACTVNFEAEAACRVELEQPARAVTPGQYAVFYRGDECLGGGVIASRSARPVVPASASLEYTQHI
jgi:tRNA-uridine 2-sulfurtransferase